VRVLSPTKVQDRVSNKMGFQKVEMDSKSMAI
jgi:hypothetical protein